MKTTIELYHKIKNHSLFIKESMVIPREGERVFLNTPKGTIAGDVIEVTHEIDKNENTHYIKVTLK